VVGSGEQFDERLEFIKCWDILTNGGTVRLSRRTQIRGVSLTFRNRASYI
jgi:hypothetical protein